MSHLAQGRRLSRKRRRPDQVLHPGVQREVAQLVIHEAKRYGVPHPLRRASRDRTKEKVVWRSDREKIHHSNVFAGSASGYHYTREPDNDDSRQRKHAGRRTNAAHAAFVKNVEYQLWPYCSGCHCLFPKTHQMLNHRKTFRCGGEWNEFVTLGPPTVPEREYSYPGEWKRIRNGTKFSLDKPRLVDPNPGQHHKLKDIFKPKPVRSLARIPGTVRIGRIPNVAGGRYCKSPDKWRKKCIASSLFLGLAPLRPKRLDRIALARGLRKKSVQSSPNKLFSELPSSAFL